MTTNEQIQSILGKMTNNSHLNKSERIALWQAIGVLDKEENDVGNWKDVHQDADYKNGWITFTCENCGHKHTLENSEYGWHYGEPIPWKYCPLCGSFMEEH